MGAVHALRGYRTQFLYSLHKILFEYENGFTYKPEGKFEDLDVIDEKGNYVEIIQIKNLSGILSFSDLFSSSDSFFKRALKVLRFNDNVVLKIVSFGQISEELSNKSSLSRKLVKKGFKTDEIENLLKNYSSPIIVSEVELEKEIALRLNEIRPFSDPKVLIEVLLFWIYNISEKQKEINSKNIISELDRIEGFIGEIKGFQNQFGNTIIPLSNKNIENEDGDKLKKEFYYGISARYEHILSGLDLIRYDKLTLVKEAFKTSNIVFIHGASGQGKSTLAYRYLYEYSSSFVAYELKISRQISEVFETINTLNALCKGLSFPVILYLDIKPKDVYWNEILKELSTKNNLSILVTIRQEDWNRTNLGAEFSFQGIELNFDKVEAQTLYSNLSNFNVDLKFTSFQESWVEFGRKGLLLEYIYLINQGDKLKNRLSGQILRLETEENITELEILRYVCLSDLFNSRINYNHIIEELGINRSLSSSYIRLLEKEYLLKLSDDKDYLTGLHPIRSKILCEILFDENDYVDIADYIKKALPLINEEDLHSFLLNSFLVGLKVEDLLESIPQKKLKSWHGLINIFNALLWKGAYEYSVVDNRKVIDEAYDLLKNAWWIFIPIDFSETRSDADPYQLLNILEKNEEARGRRINQIEGLNSRLLPKEDVFKYSQMWLEGINEVDIDPSDGAEWKSMGEFLFWIGFLNIEVDFKIDSKKLISYFENNVSEVDNQTTVLLGLKKSSFFRDDIILRSELEENFLKNFRKHFSIPVLINEDKEISIKYFFRVNDNFHNENNQLKLKSFNSILEVEPDEEFPSERPNIFHERTISILEVIREAFPEKDRYKINGIGYNFSGIDNDYDPTSKNIPKNNMPLKYLVKLNGLIIHLYDYNHRLKTWRQYVSVLLEQRETLLSILRDFRKGLILYFKNETKGIDYFIQNEEQIKSKLFSLNDYQLPRVIADRWCYYGDSTREKIGDDKIAFSMRNYKKFTSHKNNYFASIRNFINNSFVEIGNTLKRLNNRIDEVENPNLRNITEINITDAFKESILFNTEFENKFEKYTDKKALATLLNGEIATITSLITIWKAFIYSQHRYQPSIHKSSSINFEKTKIDLKLKMLKEYKALFEQGDFLQKIVTSERDKRLIFLLNVDRTDYVEAIVNCFGFMIEIFGSMHHSSLKKALVDINYQKITLILLFQGRPLNNKFLEVPINRVDLILSKIDQGYVFENPMELFDISEELDQSIILEENLIPWSEIIPEVKVFEELYGILSSIKYLLLHVKQVFSNEFDDKDSFGEQILKDYLNELLNFIKMDVVEESNKRVLRINQLLEDRFETERIKLAKDLVGQINSIVKVFDKMNHTNLQQLAEESDFFNGLEGFDSSYEVFSEILISEYVS